MFFGLIIGVLIFGIWMGSLIPSKSDAMYFRIARILELYDSLIKEENEQDAYSSRAFEDLNKTCKSIYLNSKSLLKNTGNVWGIQYNRITITAFSVLFSKKLYVNITKLSADDGLFVESIQRYLEKYADAFSVSNIKKIEEINNELIKDQSLEESEEIPELACVSPP